MRRPNWRELLVGFVIVLGVAHVVALLWLYFSTRGVP
jgi:hypothetical protein